MKCLRCQRELSVYDTGFYRKLVNRGAEECMCIGCTADHFRISEEEAWKMIRRFQKTGCLLFPPAKDPQDE